MRSVPLRARWLACRASRWLRVLVLLAGSLIAGVSVAASAQRALLVGVSELPGQPQANWLRAPGNDVGLMRQALLDRGWAPASIELLADGVSGAQLPELARIRAALAGLVDSAAPGDFVLLYFSGHGTRLRDLGKAYQEPDDRSEMFLARGGALHDEEIGRWVQRLLARGAFVWAMFDTCSAASMTRGGAGTLRAGTNEADADDPILFRGLAAGQLEAGVKRAALAAPVGLAVAGDAPYVPPARYVAFFAAESHQVTPELRLPRRQPEARMHGLLTWAVVEALKHDPPTWRALFNEALARYPAVIDELEQRFPARELPSPVAEGVLDAPLLRNAGPIAATQPAWPARRDGTELVVAAGRLDGLDAGQALRISAQEPDGPVRDAVAVAPAPGLGSVRLPLPPPLRAGTGDASWQVVPTAAPTALALRVRIDGAGTRQALAGLNLPYPASLQLVDAGPADLRVQARAGGFTVRADSSDEAHMAADAAALRRYLAGQAVQRWLDRLVQLAREPAAAPLDGFEATLWAAAEPGAELRPEPLAAQLPQPPASAALDIANASGHSLDLMIVGVAPDGGLWPVFPIVVGESNRFERGDAGAPARKRFTLPEALLRRGSTLLVLATPARPRSPPRLFGLSPPARAVTGDVLLRAVAETPADQAYAVVARW